MIKSFGKQVGLFLPNRDMYDMFGGPLENLQGYLSHLFGIVGIVRKAGLWVPQSTRVDRGWDKGMPKNFFLARLYFLSGGKVD